MRIFFGAPSPTMKPEMRMLAPFPTWARVERLPSRSPESAARPWRGSSAASTAATANEKRGRGELITVEKEEAEARSTDQAPEPAIGGDPSVHRGFAPVQVRLELPAQVRVGRGGRFPEQQGEGAERATARMAPRARMGARVQAIGAQVEEQIVEHRRVGVFVARVFGVGARGGKRAAEPAGLEREPALQGQGRDLGVQRGQLGPREIADRRMQLELDAGGMMPEHEIEPRPRGVGGESRQAVVAFAAAPVVLAVGGE